MPIQPTPTQSELDRAATGEHVLEKEDDGSGPDPHVKANEEAQAKAQGKSMAPKTGASAGYQTRQATPTGRTGGSTGGAST